MAQGVRCSTLIGPVWVVLAIVLPRIKRSCETRWKLASELLVGRVVAGGLVTFIPLHLLDMNPCDLENHDDD